MRKTDVIYCGSLGRIAEYIHMSGNFNLKGVICEERQLGSDILTFSFLRGITITPVNNYTEFKSQVARFDKGCIFLMCGFGIIVKDDILLNTRFFNIHPSKLPNYRGRHPTFYSTVNGDTHFGITLHEVNNKIDDGNIIAVEECPYYYWMAENDILCALFERTPSLLEKLSLFIDGKLNYQSNKGGQYFPPVSIAHKTIELSDNVALILNKIRAQSKHGGAVLKFHGIDFMIKKAVVEKINPDHKLAEGRYVLSEQELVGLKISDKYYIKFIEVVKEAIK